MSIEYYIPPNLRRPLRRAYNLGYQILDNVIGFDDEYETSGERLGTALRTDPVNTASEFGKSAYQGARQGLMDFANSPTQFASDLLDSTISNIGDAGSRLSVSELTPYLPEGVSESTATNQQLRDAYGTMLGDVTTIGSLVPATRGAAALGGLATDAGAEINKRFGADIAGFGRAVAAGDLEQIGEIFGPAGQTSDLSAAVVQSSLGADILFLKAKSNPRLNQILMDFNIDPSNADAAPLPIIDAALDKAVNQNVIDPRDANALLARFAERDQTPAGETTPYSQVEVIDPRDLVGAKISPTPADLTRAGSFYEGIDAAGTTRRTPFLGGPLFPLQQAYRDADVAWMVDSKSKGQTKLNKDSDFVAVTAMSPKAHQSNATVADAYMGTLEAYIKDGRLPEESIDQLNKVVTEFGKNTVDPELQRLKNFVGFDSPYFNEYMRGLTFPQREAISKLMTAPKVRDIGGPNFQRILDSSIQPEFAGSNLGDTLLLLELNKKAGLLDVNELGLPEHPSYSVGLPGRVVGRFENPMSRGLLFSDFEAEYSNRPTIMRSDGTPDPAQMAYAFSRALPTTEITPEGARNMQEAMQYYSIEQPLQAQLIDQALQSNWKTSLKPYAQGKGEGISPIEYQRALERNPSYPTLEPYTAQEIAKGAREGNFEVLQLGRSDIYFGLKKNPDYTWMNDGKPVPGLSDNEVDLVGVVSNEIGAKGVASPAIMGKAIEEGASVLNAFAVPSERYPEGFLPNVYGGYGFEEIKRIPFSKEFYIEERGEAAYRDLLRQWRSEGWDESQGFPDVVLMKWSGTDEQRANASQRVFDKGFAGFGSGEDLGPLRSAGQNLESSVEASSKSQVVQSDNRRRDTGAVRSGSGSSKSQGIRSAVEELRSLSPLQRKNLGLLSFDY
jgi:hypothetical protein